MIYSPGDNSCNLGWILKKVRMVPTFWMLAPQHRRFETRNYLARLLLVEGYDDGRW
jgi:hypothetical protein